MRGISVLSSVSIDNATTQSGPLGYGTLNIYAYPPVRPLQSRDNPPMIYAVNFLRDIASRREFPGTCNRARVAFATMKEGKKGKRREKNSTADAREGRKLEAHLDEERIAWIVLENACSVSLTSPTRSGVALFVKSSGGNEIYFVLVSNPRR